MEPSSAKPSRLPTLRQSRRRPGQLVHDNVSLHRGPAEGGRTATSHVSNSTIASAHRALIGVSHHPHSSRKRGSYCFTPSASSSMSSVVSDYAASHNLFNDHGLGASPNSTGVGTTRLFAPVSALSPTQQQPQQSFPQQTQGQQDTHSSPLHGSGILATTAAATTTKFDTPTEARLPHLEYTGQIVSLPPQLYLSKLQPKGGEVDGSIPTEDGLMALRESTTGLLVRHLAPEGPGMLKRRASIVATTTTTTNDGDLEKFPNTPGVTYEAARAEALMKAAPLVSAALLDAGVDDRINPYLLDKMIRQCRRRVAAAAAKTETVDAKGKIGRLRTNHAASFPPGAAASRTTVSCTLDEVRFHEPPALQAAYNVVSLPAIGNGAAEKDADKHEDRGKTAQGDDVSAEILAEYARDTRNEEAAGTPRSAPLLQQKRIAAKRGVVSTMHNAKSMPPMSSPDYTRLASAASANDGAFVRQLVYYYSARARDTAAAAVAASKKPTGTTASNTTTKATRLPLTSSAIESVKDGTFVALDQPQHTATVDPQIAAALSANQAEVGNEFSLLDAVLSVSREYVEVQSSEMGVPGKGMAVLTERRRHLTRRLITLDQTRIPESLWVTCAPPLSRLTALTTASTTQPSAVTTTSRTSPPQADMTQEDREKISNALVEGGTRNGTYSSFSATAKTATSAADDKLNTASEQVRALVEMASVVAAHSEDIVHNHPRPTGGVGVPATVTGINSIFPAVRPVERSQVYLLADVLDRMLHDPSHPQWVELLSDPEIARYIFTEEDIHADDALHSNEDFDRDARLQMRRATQDRTEALWGPPGEERLMAYSDAAYQVLDILDTGLSELVRQVACHCTERGALLDLLRQSVIDIAIAQVHLLTQVKQQARQDAATAFMLKTENAQLHEQLSRTQRELAELKEAHAQLHARIEPIQQKSDRLDELMTRVASKARRFETHRRDEHIALLQLLEESMKQTASTAADNFYNEVNDIRARHVNEDGSGETNPRGGIPLMLAAEMPSVAAARTHAAEQRQTMQRMYTESYQLLRMLQDTVEATNAVCAPLYKKMILTDVSPMAKVATSKWTTIARAVGAFEKEKQHRMRVYEVFTEYCTVFRHKQAAAAAAAAAIAAGDKGVANPHDLSKTIGVANMPTDAVHSYGESFLVEPSPQKKEKKRAGGEGGEHAEGDGEHEDDGGHGDDDARSPNEDDDLRDVNVKVRTLRNGVSQFLAHTGLAGMSASSATSANPFGTVITQSDLESMSATDCTVEEVNALFRKDFDARTYLRGSWEDYVQEYRLQDTASGLDDAYTLRLPDLLQMLSDAHATLAEVTMRMRAMANSGVLQAFLKPPLEPPAHPEVPCPLCSRRDTCERDRQRRREAMSRIARDLQGKMDAVEAKSRVAQLERDEAKREVRRLQMELQHISKGNMPMQNHNNQSNSSGSLQNTRGSSMESFFRERRDTSTPRPPGTLRESSMVRTSIRNRDEGTSVSRRHRVRRSSMKSFATKAQSLHPRGPKEVGDDSDTTEVNVEESSMTPVPRAESAERPVKSGEDEDDFLPDGVSDTDAPTNRRDTVAM